MRKKILIISHGEVGNSMAGTGMRYHYMAETLVSAGFDVTLGFFSPEYLPDEGFKRSYKVASVNVHHFEEHLKNTDVIIAMWVSEAIINFCNTNDKLLIFDIYAPVPVETLAQKVFSSKKITEDDEFAYSASAKDYRLFLENGDAFLVSNKRQLDYWMGYAMGAGQVTLNGFLKRNIYDQFLITPMGFDINQKLVPGKPLYKGVLPGVEKDDIVMIWNGGIYDWYDGVTLVEAMKLVKNLNHKIKMIFPGTQHPNKTLPKWQETIDTQRRAKELGLVGKNVFFFDSWVNFHDRISFLLEADIAIYTHKPSIESEFSHRTRVLDHLLAKLPTIATQGDYFADLVERYELGLTVPAYDKQALSNAIVELAKPDNLKTAETNIGELRKDFDWSVTLGPLVNYLQSQPAKVTQLTTFKPTPLHNPKLKPLKRYTPKIVKKTAVRVMPRRLRKKLLN